MVWPAGGPDAPLPDAAPTPHQRRRQFRRSANAFLLRLGAAPTSAPSASPTAVPTTPTPVPLGLRLLGSDACCSYCGSNCCSNCGFQLRAPTCPSRLPAWLTAPARSQREPTSYVVSTFRRFLCVAALLCVLAFNPANAPPTAAPTSMPTPVPTFTS